MIITFSNTFAKILLQTSIQNPQVCACCLAPSESSLPVKGSGSTGFSETTEVDIEVPLCRECKKHVQSFQQLGIWLPLLGGILGIILWRLFHIDIFVFIALLGLLAAVPYFIYQSLWIKKHPDHTRSRIPISILVSTSPEGGLPELTIWFWNRDFGQQFAAANHVKLEGDET